MQKIIIAFILSLSFIGCNSQSTSSSVDTNHHSAIPATTKAWKLSDEQFIPAAMSMTVIHPRPDSETNSWARNRNAYPGLRYELPIGVQGGAWPFFYQIIDGPNGASIGEMYGEENYGVITWTAPSVEGEHNFTVRVTDQEYHYVDINWSVNVNKATFVFLDKDNGNDTNDGTLEAPLKTFAGMYHVDTDDTTYAQKILVVRESNESYQLIGHTANNGNVRLNSTKKPIVWIAYPDESPVFDASQAKILTEKPYDDFYMGGIRFEHGRQDVNNAHFFWVAAVGDRITFFQNYFYDLGPGVKGNDNTGPVFISRTKSESNISVNAPKHYILAKQNTYDEIRNKGYNGQYFEFYTTKYVLIEEEVAKNSDSSAGWYAKGAISHTTMRANTAVDNVYGQQMGGSYGEESGEVPHDFEFCYNNIHTQDSTVAYPAFMMARSNYYLGEGYATSIYRNTVTNGIAKVRFYGADLYHLNGNVFNNGQANAEIFDSEYEENLIATGDETFVDENHSLTGEYIQYKGIRGHEIVMPLSS
ncbi:hypothetical protein [Sulfurimonas sp.]|uniref:hypothetical protein n=1 Tax=Sulfurimonas sp. TaxID=2022749 RepID=UPI003D10FE1E